MWDGLAVTITSHGRPQAALVMSCHGDFSAVDLTDGQVQAATVPSIGINRRHGGLGALIDMQKDCPGDSCRACNFRSRPWLTVCHICHLCRQCTGEPSRLHSTTSSKYYSIRALPRLRMVESRVSHATVDKTDLRSKRMMRRWCGWQVSATANLLTLAPESLSLALCFLHVAETGMRTAKRVLTVE